MQLFPSFIQTILLRDFLVLSEFVNQYQKLVCLSKDYWAENSRNTPPQLAITCSKLTIETVFTSTLSFCSVAFHHRFIAVFIAQGKIFEFSIKTHQFLSTFIGNILPVWFSVYISIEFKFHPLFWCFYSWLRKVNAGWALWKWFDISHPTCNGFAIQAGCDEMISNKRIKLA